jgi:hypothetical protein
MKLLAIEGERSPDVRPSRRDTRLRRIVRRTFYAKLALAFCVLLVALACYLRLVAGPVSLRDYSERVSDALAARLGPGWHVELADTAIELQGVKPAVRTTGLEIRNPAGQLVVRAPYAVVSLDPTSIFVGTLTPREIELRDLQLLARVAADGSLSFVPPVDPARPTEQSSGGPLAPPAAASGQPAEGGPSPVSRAVASLLEPVLGSSSLIGALDRASIANARLTVFGADGRERAAFTRVNASFERVEDGIRRMSIDLDGPGGAWRLGGLLREDGAARQAELQASLIPLQDAMLLTGMSSFPALADLKLSGAISASLTGDRLTSFVGRFESTPGSITQPGQKPIKIDRLAVGASWDEAGHRFDLADLQLKIGGTEASLAGTLTAHIAGGSWRLKLSGRDASWAGATPRDPAFKVDELSAEASFAEAGVALDRVTFRGQDVDLSVSGAMTPSPAGPSLRALIEGRGTSVRRFLAFWPDNVNPELRGYLAQNLGSGMLDRMQLRTELDPEDVKSAFSGRPISDAGLSLTFAVSDAKMNIIDGLPPLTKLAFLGAATGTTTTLTEGVGRVEMPDGRRLAFSDGSFRQTDEHMATSVAQIGFRLNGGADALASLLRSPIFREFGSFDIDPGNVKGRVDLRVTLPLMVHNIPPVAELPIGVSGTLTDISVERIVGREKLDGAQLAVTYDSGALSIRGEGKLGGSPATFDLRQPKAGPGEAVVNLMLDEAARSRRSLPTAPQVSGPIAVKLVSPFGPGSKGPTRAEADLSKTAVDGLLPGWSKLAGRPGRISFAFGDGEGTELRDIVLESGPVQLRGTASFSADGALDRADLSTLKLSPGDDLRAGVDRTGGVYKVSLKGNVGDARPVLKWLTGSGSGAGAGQKGREPPDLDIDAAINIVTGNNDEALTGVVARIGTRGRDLRALQLRGQFRSAAVEAQLVREAGQPQLLVKSGDAGATLRFLDLYKRMVGGELLVKTTIGEAVQSGTITIGSFAVRNEPALRSIAANTSQAGSEDRTGAVTERLEADQVDFVKLNAEFKRSASRVEYKDVVVWGSQVGFTLGGYVDYARDRTEILGTFVPAYGLNNAFSQVPIVGLLLGGGNRNEGLFAIDFKVSGQASAPTLTVNPLTAVAPGILRKLFSWMLPEDEATGATLPLSERERRTRLPRMVPRGDSGN